MQSRTRLSQLLGLLALGIVMLPACWDRETPQPNSKEVVHHDPIQSSLPASSLKVINLLSKDLYDDAHIKGSINISLGELEAAAQQWDRNTPIVVYCSNYACTSSGLAAKKLAKLGFTNVKAYEGGTAEWYQLYQKDSTYGFEGPGKQGYLTMVLKPLEPEPDVQVIRAENLKKEMQEAHLL